MAKASSIKSGVPARIRFVVIDAEIPDGDIGSVTQVIQNALRSPTTVVQQRMAAPTAPPKAITHEPSPEHELEVQDEVGLVEDIAEAPRPSKPRGPRKPPPTPDPVTIEMDKEVSLATFVKDKDVGSQHKKYLAAAAWLKEHRGIDGVTAGHIYTCFRSMGWPTNIQDFWQPLRSLKAKKFFTTNQNGEYFIHHIGLDYVRKLGGSNATE